MAIYPRQKTIFVAVPKTAGTSIAAHLNQHAQPLAAKYLGIDLGIGHATRAELVARGLWFGDYFKFAFVRNPWARLVSAFFFLAAGGVAGKDGTLRRRYVAKYGDDFEQFVMDFLTPENARKVIHFRSQCDFVCDDDGRPALDFIGRFEQLDADFGRVCATMGIPSGNLERRAVSDHHPYASYYTPRLRDRVASVYAADVRGFGYEFE